MPMKMITVQNKVLGQFTTLKILMQLTASREFTNKMGNNLISRFLQVLTPISSGATQLNDHNIN